MSLTFMKLRMSHNFRVNLSEADDSIVNWDCGWWLSVLMWLSCLISTRPNSIRTWLETLNSNSGGEARL